MNKQLLARTAQLAAARDALREIEGGAPDARSIASRGLAASDPGTDLLSAAAQLGALGGGVRTAAKSAAARANGALGGRPRKHQR